MAFALPVWLVVQEELLARGGADDVGPRCSDDYDDESLFRTFHLTRACMAFITDAVRSRVKARAEDASPLSADAMVTVALNYYAHGVSSAAVLQRVGLSPAERAASVVDLVSAVIVDMSEQFISFPQCRDAQEGVASRTERSCGIPGALGVLAPAHFRIRASPYEKNSFRSFVNSLGYTSVVSQLICDSDGNILSVERCRVGSADEQDMWESSTQGREMEKELHGPYWLIGGRGYQQSKHVLTPVSAPESDSEIRFNEAHAKIHSVMRTTQGSMKRRFRCLMQLGFAQEATLSKKSNIIEACCVLHNIAKKFSVPPPPVAGKIEPLHKGRQHLAQVEVSPEALQARRRVIDGFSSVSANQDPPGDSVPGETEGAGK